MTQFSAHATFLLFEGHYGESHCDLYLPIDVSKLVERLRRKDRTQGSLFLYGSRPYPRAVEARHSQGPMVSAFSTDLSEEKCFRSSKVKVWAFGHTHYNLDFSVEMGGGAGPLRLVANQRGSSFAQATGFDVENVVEL